MNSNRPTRALAQHNISHRCLVEVALEVRKLLSQSQHYRNTSQINEHHNENKTAQTSLVQLLVGLGGFPVQDMHVCITMHTSKYTNWKCGGLAICAVGRRKGGKV